MAITRQQLEKRLKEEGVDISKFEDILSEISTQKFGLIWENHPEEIERSLKSNIPLLVEDQSMRIDKGENLTNNFLIEGDNLESLHTLQRIGKKVDVIYIDPPYNTGNEFVYNDKIVGKDDSFRHSKWLSFMEKRLKVARDLMNDDGVIFVSIDDNEQAHLKMLMDQVFGEENFLIDLIRKTKSTTNDAVSNVNIQHENTLVYCKNKKTIKPFIGKDKNFSNYTNPDNHPKGDWISSDPTARSGTMNSYFEIINPHTGKIDVPSSGKYWRFSKNTFQKHIDNDTIIFKEKHKPNERGFIYRRFKQDLKSNMMPVGSLDFTDKMYMNQTGTKSLNDVIGGGIFSYPKPINFIQNLIKTHPNKNAIVLDFFAGSGTTGHAVLELNKEDGGNRQFILCTNNENDICRDVTYQRLNKVINGYTTPKGKEVEGLPANLTYLTTELTSDWNTNVFFDDTDQLKTHVLNSVKINHHLGHAVKINDNTYMIKSDDDIHYVLFDDVIDPDIIDQLNKDSTLHVDMSLYNERHLKDFKTIKTFNQYIR